MILRDGSSGFGDASLAMIQQSDLIAGYIFEEKPMRTWPSALVAPPSGGGSGTRAEELRGTHHPPASFTVALYTPSTSGESNPFSDISPSRWSLSLTGRESHRMVCTVRGVCTRNGDFFSLALGVVQGSGGLLGVRVVARLRVVIQDSRHRG